MTNSARWLLLLLAFCFPALGKSNAKIRNWEWLGDGGSGAWLHTETTGNTVRFHLELNRGSLSYNSGTIAAEFTLNRYIGIYQPSDFRKCTLIFAFVGDAVEVQQLGSDSDCGFGFGFMASHVLSLRHGQSDSSPPID